MAKSNNHNYNHHCLYSVCVCVCVCVLVAQLCLTLCNPMDCSPLCSSVRGILQARILKRVAISFCRRSSQSRDGTQVSCIRQIFNHLNHQGSPLYRAYNKPDTVRRAHPILVHLILIILRGGHYVILIFTQEDTETYRC